MSTSKTYHQSLVDVGSKTRPPMLEWGSYIPWARDALLHYDAGMELMNLILLSIPNDIYNSVDACTSAKDMWKRVEPLMRGTIQNKVDRETHFTNEFDQFVAEPGEALVSVYNHFAQLMNDLERNDMHFLIVTINIKFLNSLQPEWLKYVTQVRLAKHLTVDMFDDLFDYLQQFEKLVNVSRAKKLEKSHDPLALVAHTGSSSRNTSSYYVTHPTSVVYYEGEYQNQAIIQGDRVNIQSRNSGNAGRNNRRAYVQEEIVEGSNAPNETGNVQRTLRTSSSGNTSTVQCYNCSGKGHYARNCPKPRVRDSKYFMEQMLLAKQDEAGVILTDEQNDFLFDASRMEEIEELSANICLMARIQPADNTSDAGPSYDFAFISEVQSSSNNENEEQMYPTHTKIINSTIGDDQIDSDIIFDSPNGNVNSGSIEKDTHVPDLCALEQLARNAYQEAEKQQIFAQKADKRAKHFSQQAQSQFVRDRDIIRNLEKQLDKLDLNVKDYKWQNEVLQMTHSILKRLTFMLDKKKLSLTLDDFRTIFHLPQANNNNHDSFVPPPSFLDMVPFYKQQLGFTMELKTSSSFKTTGLLQPWQTLCKIFSKCMTTRVTGWDQPSLQIMKISSSSVCCRRADSGNEQKTKKRDGKDMIAKNLLYTMRLGNIQAVNFPHQIQNAIDNHKFLLKLMLATLPHDMLSRGGELHESGRSPTHFLSMIAYEVGESSSGAGFVTYARNGLLGLYQLFSESLVIWEECMIVITGNIDKLCSPES
ncbi:integrase, catalytic region, zinc finger, CCHC-type containing protein [Tanacetum coccineum]|uniref:Integrase, catalytic region, zinc finger, CCHC-type containing protein n=1 Tax=Tanacetum coccineum TaxID=301880 RepID=A0ABQ5H8N0_9ASTR